MTSRLNPYISFNGQARQALEFYQSVLGGELAVNTFGDFAQAGGDHAAVADQIMHGQLETDAGFTHHGGRHAAGHGATTRAATSP